MLRNKAAHLGSPVLRQMGLPRRGDGRLFVFLPRQWPHLWEKQIKSASEPAQAPSEFQTQVRDEFMHQDIVSYCEGLVGKVQSVIAAISDVLNEAYEHFKHIPENQIALKQLEGCQEKFGFENFCSR
jgi:hypothetical protein